MELKHTNSLRSDLILLLLAVLLQQIHPILLCLVLIFMFLRDRIRGTYYKTFCFYNIFVGLIFVQFFYCGFTNGNMSFHNAIWYSIPSVLTIILGHNFAKKTINPKQIMIFLLCISFFIALPHIIITFKDIFNSGLINPDRSLSLAGYDDTQRAVTARAVELSMAICGIAALYTKKYKSINKIANCFIVLAILAELCTLHYVSRTGIAILLIALITGLLLNRPNLKQIMSITILSLLAYYLFESSGLLDIFSAREIKGSSLMDAGGRTDRWFVGFELLIERPFGYNIDHWYAHNFWLDFGRVGGLASFFLLCAFSIMLFIKTLRIRRLHVIGDYNSLLIVVFSVTFLATLFTEPIHSGAPLYMYFYFLFAGFVDGLYNLNNS